MNRQPPGPTGIRLTWGGGAQVHADHMLSFLGLQDGVNTFVISVPAKWFDDWRKGEMEVHIGTLPGLTQVALAPEGVVR